MEAWEAIRSRRNVRDFDDRPIALKDLDQILEAGRRSPSSMNEQPWDFVVVTDRERLQEVAKVWQYATHVATSAATVALVAPNAPDEYHRSAIHYDLGQATMSMMIAATALGIGSAHAAVGEAKLAQALLGFPDGFFCDWLVSFGYPADRPMTPIANPARRSFDDVVHRDRW
jgi:nitroreductase